MAEKFESFKLEDRNENGKIEVEKFAAKLESSGWSLKLQMKLESYFWTRKDQWKLKSSIDIRMMMRVYNWLQLDK